MAALAPHAATDVYESADDYDELECVRDVNQQDWSHDCQTLAMTQSDLNNFPKWLDEVKAAHKIRTNYGDLGDITIQLNFKQSVAVGLAWRHIINVNVHGQNNVQQLLLNISGAAGTSNSLFPNIVTKLAKEELGRDGIVRAAAALLHTSSTEIHYTVSSICLLARANVCRCIVTG